MVWFVFFPLSLVAALAFADKEAFLQWKNTHAKTYSNADEENKRYAVWMETRQFIENTNAKDLGYELGLNQFSDLSHKEFGRLMSLDSNAQEIAEFAQRHGKLDTLSSKRQLQAFPSRNLDWRSNSGCFVTPIRNQGQCGSCWAFAMLAGIESWAIIQYPSRYTCAALDLSEQQMLDCTKGSCDGYDSAYSLREMAATKQKLVTEHAYRYAAVQGQCKGANYQTDGILSLSSVTQVQGCAALLAGLDKGPQVVYVYVDNIFQSYKTGVLAGTNGQQSNHAVLAVGYGTENGRQYILIKNSWGEWGDKGYMKLGYNSAGVCEFAIAPTALTAVKDMNNAGPVPVGPTPFLAPSCSTDSDCAKLNECADSGTMKYFACRTSSCIATTKSCYPNKCQNGSPAVCGAATTCDAAACSARSTCSGNVLISYSCSGSSCIQSQSTCPGTCVSAKCQSLPSNLPQGSNCVQNGSPCSNCCASSLSCQSSTVASCSAGASYCCNTITRPTDTCATNADCASLGAPSCSSNRVLTNVCSAGTCVQQFTSCGSGSCVDGRCSSAQCAIDRDCLSLFPMRCNGKVLSQGKCSGGKCQDSSSSCPTGYTCSATAGCQLATANSCRTAAECSGTLSCRNGQRTYLACENSQCVSKQEYCPYVCDPRAGCSQPQLQTGDQCSFNNAPCDKCCPVGNICRMRGMDGSSVGCSGMYCCTPSNPAPTPRPSGSCAVDADCPGTPACSATGRRTWPGCYNGRCANYYTECGANQCKPDGCMLADFYDCSRDGGLTPCVGCCSGAGSQCLKYGYQGSTKGCSDGFCCLNPNSQRRRLLAEGQADNTIEVVVVNDQRTNNVYLEATANRTTALFDLVSQIFISSFTNPGIDVKLHRQINFVTVDAWELSSNGAELQNQFSTFVANNPADFAGKTAILMTSVDLPFPNEHTATGSLCSAAGVGVVQYAKDLTTTATRVAHVLGHMLGAETDGLPHNSCNGDFVMADVDSVNTKFSTCSIDQIRSRLSSFPCISNHVGETSKRDAPPAPTDRPRLRVALISSPDLTLDSAAVKSMMNNVASYFSELALTIDFDLTNFKPLSNEALVNLFVWDATSVMRQIGMQGQLSGYVDATILLVKKSVLSDAAWAFEGTMCGRASSVGVARVDTADETAGLRIAHAIGRLLGLQFDSAGTNCGEGFIMSKELLSDKTTTVFSKKFSACSVKDMAANLKKFPCLMPMNSDVNNIAPSCKGAAPGTSCLNDGFPGSCFADQCMSRAAQCVRSGFSGLPCPQEDNANSCTQLYCLDIKTGHCSSVVNSASGSYLRVLEGSPCGTLTDPKICSNGVCTASVFNLPVNNNAQCTSTSGLTDCGDVGKCNTQGQCQPNADRQCILLGMKGVCQTRNDFQCHRLYCSDYVQPDKCVRMEGVRVVDGANCGDAGFRCAAGLCRPAATTNNVNTFNLGLWAKCPNSCNNQGICDTKTGICECDAGWAGSDCSVDMAGVWSAGSAGALQVNHTLAGRDWHYYTLSAAAGKTVSLVLRGSADCDIFLSNLTSRPTLNNFSWSGTETGVDERLSFTIPADSKGPIAFGVTTGQSTGATYSLQLADGEGAVYSMVAKEAPKVGPTDAPVTPDGKPTGEPSNDLSGATRISHVGAASLFIVVVTTVLAALL